MDRQISAIILAGGLSSRMGTNKAELLLDRKRFLEIQIEKCRQLGIQDILLSGYSGRLPGTRSIPDVIAHCGPMSGLHACLESVQNPAALVLAIDTPLVPVSALFTLLEAHTSGITMLSCSGKAEPLIAVYDIQLCDRLAKKLEEGHCSLMRLASEIGFQTVAYTGDPALLMNCNTPEEYWSLCTNGKTH